MIKYCSVQTISTHRILAAQTSLCIGYCRIARSLHIVESRGESKHFLVHLSGMIKYRTVQTISAHRILTAQTSLYIGYCRIVRGLHIVEAVREAKHFLVHLGGMIKYCSVQTISAHRILTTQTSLCLGYCRIVRGLHIVEARGESKHFLVHLGGMIKYCSVQTISAHRILAAQTGLCLGYCRIARSLNIVEACGESKHFLVYLGGMIKYRSVQTIGTHRVLAAQTSLCLGYCRIVRGLHIVEAHGQVHHIAIYLRGI